MKTYTKLECHHIVPKFMGGEDERANMVLLSPEEHIQAHQRLADEHPEHRAGNLAAIQLIKERHNMQQRKEFTGVFIRQDGSIDKYSIFNPEGYIRKCFYNNGFAFAYAVDEETNQIVYSMVGEGHL